VWRAAIAECTGRSVEEVARETTKTAARFFGLDPIKE
jgi:Tat protein secretion system quality control protein TatD with DNase activity